MISNLYIWIYKKVVATPPVGREVAQTLRYRTKMYSIKTGSHCPTSYHERQVPILYPHHTRRQARKQNLRKTKITLHRHLKWRNPTQTSMLYHHRYRSSNRHRRRSTFLPRQFILEKFQITHLGKCRCLSCIVILPFHLLLVHRTSA